MDIEAVKRSLPALNSILVWYFANVSTVILNKYIFQMLHFAFPLTLTAVHMAICAIGCHIVLAYLPSLGIPKQSITMQYFWQRIFPLSFLFCFNIVLGNISLKFIPVSFMQTIKSAVPACTVLFQVLKGEHSTTSIYLSLIPIVGGVMVATYTEVNYNAIGFWTAVLASFVTAGMAIISGLVLTQKLNPISLLYYMAPPSFVMLLPLVWWFEGDGLLASPSARDQFVMAVLIASGAIAFFLNISSFFVIQRTSPLTFTVAGNFKVVLSITISVMIFKNEITMMNALGCTAAILGVAWYNQIRYEMNKTAARPPETK